MENLHQLVNRLTADHQNSVERNDSYFINDIPCDLSLDHNLPWITSVISSLLATVGCHARKTCIRLSAQKQGHVIVLIIKESGKTNGYVMANDLQQAYLLAEKIGGCLSISVPTIDYTTISFSFPHIPSVAAMAQIGIMTDRN